MFILIKDELITRLWGQAAISDLRVVFVLEVKS